MLANYLLTALRNLAKNRLYSAINIGGLAVGLCACLLIVLFVRDELSYDRWLPNAERIAKLQVSFTVPGRDLIAASETPGPVKAPLEKDFSSDIEHVVRIFQPKQPIQIGDKQFVDTVSYVDPEFFSVFDLPMREGDRQAALSSNATILVSERMAEKYFGDQPALGKVLTMESSMDFTVVGVFRDLPHNTHLAFDFIALFDTARYTKWPSIAENWTSANTHAYVLFRDPAAIARVAEELPAFVDRNVVLDVPGFKGVKVSSVMRFNLLPALDLHLHDHLPGQMKPGGDFRTVVAFGAIALLILVIACINFVNLATARSMKRAREISLRKVVGATRRQIIAQHLGEAVVTALLALLLAVALAELALGPYNRLLGKELALDFTGDPMLILIAVALVVTVGLIGGLYPAVFLSRFRPAAVLKANQSSASGSPTLRNALVVFQFAISIALMVATGVIYAQTRYAQEVELGFQKHDKLLVTGLDDLASDELRRTLRQELAALPGVRGASLSSDTPPLQGNNNTVLFRTPVPDDEQLLVEIMRVDADFFAIYGVKPLAGRTFSRDFPGDERTKPTDRAGQQAQGIVVNQTFLTKLGYPTPEEAVGKVLWSVADGPGNLGDRLVHTTIVGVVPDMHLRSLRLEIPPMLFYLSSDPRQLDVATVDVEPGRMKEVTAAVATLWQRVSPTVPLRTAYVDDALAALYEGDVQRAQLFAVFALFAILIACLGLFGLAAFAAERRTKEIGMRKVMGASVLDIVRLLVWQFSKPVFVANLIAWPAAFWLMSTWLAGFRYAIDLTSPLLFAALFGGAGLLALLIAWGTVAGHAMKVASSSPIHALRHE